MDVTETLHRRHDEAFERGDFAEAAGWSRLGWVAEPDNPRLRAQVGMDLLRLALEAEERGEWRLVARAARQARATLSAFRHPSGIEPVDQMIMSAEVLYQTGCDRLGASGPSRFREGADVDLTGVWLSTLSASQLRLIDWVRISEAVQEAPG